MPARESVRFALKCACLLPLGLAIPAANWIAEQPPACRALGRDFKRMAAELNAGRSICVTADERPIKVAQLCSAPARYEVVILGSSRANQIAPEWFRQRSAYNAAVRAGGIDDAAAIFQLLLDTGKTPDQVVLQLDPTLTGGDLNQKDWRDLSPYLHRALRRYGMSQPWREQVERGFSTLQLRWNVSAANGISWRVPRSPAEEKYVALPDGRWVFPYVPAHSDEWIREALQRGKPGHEESRRSSRPAEFERELLGRLLDDLASRKVRVVVYLAPVHPLAYEYYSKRGGYDDRWLRAEMGRRGIPVAGYYSAAAAHAKGEDFLDEVHPRAELAKRLLEEAGVIGR